MTLGCAKQTPRGAGTVTGDTHAASLTGSQTTNTPSTGINGSTAVNPGVSIITDNTERTVQSLIPTATANTRAIVLTVIYCFSQGTGVCTVKIKRGSTVLNTPSQIAATWGSFVLVDSGFSVGANTYAVTAQQNGGSLNGFVGMTTDVIDDSHAASLTGSSGTCT